MTGRLKWFNSDRGYGFIAGDNGNDYFVHAIDLEPGIYNDGDRLVFEVAKTKKGNAAVKVKLL